MGDAQLNNDWLVKWLSGHFQGRYEPQFALANAFSTIMGIPGLRAFWPMSVTQPFVAGAGGVYVSDVVNSNPLTIVNTPQIGYHNETLVPYAYFNGTNEYLTRNDTGAGDWASITGTETYIVTAQRGLTLCGWFQWQALTAIMAMMSKWSNVVATNAYMLYMQGTGANDPLIFAIGDGGINPNVQLAISPSVDTWYYCWGRYDDASGDMSVGIDEDVTTAASGVANIAANNQAFELGARTGGARPLQGRASLCWLSACSVPDFMINNVWQQTKALYGK